MKTVLLLFAICVVVYAACPPKFNSINEVPDYFGKFIGKQLKRRHGYYKAINTDATYKFNGRAYDKITVNVNGHILFGEYKNHPAHYPLQDNPVYFDMAAVFFADNMLEACGTAYFKETHLWRHRHWFRAIIRDGFECNYWNFLPTQVFIVSYYNTDSWWLPYCNMLKSWPPCPPICCPPICCPPFCRRRRETSEDEEGDSEDFDGSDNHPDRATSKSVAPYSGLNTYQIAVGTDSDMTFVVFNYGCIGWTDAPYSMAGFYNRKDGSHRWFNLSTTADIDEVMNHGNVQPGQYVFRVDQRKTFIEDPNPEESWYV